MFVCKLHFDGHGLAITADAEIHYASRRGFSYDSAHLSGAFNGCAVHADDYVMVMQARFSGRSILVDRRDLDSMLFFELQCAESFC